MRSPSRPRSTSAYTAGFPRTKVESPHPALEVSGELSVGDERVVLDAWDGILGHNWGRVHAERWVWLQAPLDDGYVDIAAARVRVGRRTLPWIANGGLLLDCEHAALGGLGRLGATRVSAETGRCSFVVAGPGVRVRGTLSAPVADLVGWEYADPDGGGHHVTNSSVADLDLTVERRGRPPGGWRYDASEPSSWAPVSRSRGCRSSPSPTGEPRRWAPDRGPRRSGSGMRCRDLRWGTTGA